MSACRLLNAWDYAARFVVSTKYRFDEDSAVDEFSERGRLLLRHEHVSARAVFHAIADTRQPSDQ